MLPDAFLTTPIAHRTLHDKSNGLPENSLIGTKAAIKRGYGIELDLQLSRDGVPMVFHDYELERLTGQTGLLSDYTAQELGQMTLLGGEEGIPTFAAFLELVAGRVPLLVEIKDQDGQLGSNTDTLEQATCELVFGYRGPLALMSFNPHSVARCAHYAPNIPRGLVTDGFDPQDWPGVPEARLAELRTIPDYTAVGACFLSHYHRNLGFDRVAAIKTEGNPILCWTIRSKEQEDAARQIADNITFENYLA